MVRERVPLVAELELERARDGAEEPDVDQRPDDEVEDLLDDIAAEDAGERRSLDDRDVHEEHHERAHVRGHEVVQCDAGRVGGEHRHVRDAAGVRVAQDPVPAECGEHGLEPLEETAQDDVADRDLGERAPELLEPAPDVDPGQMQEDEDEERPDDPRGDPEQPVLLGIGCGRRRDCDVGHRTSLTCVADGGGERRGAVSTPPLRRRASRRPAPSP